MFPGLFYHHSYPIHHFLPLMVLVSFSLVKTKEQITTVYVVELWVGHCQCPRFLFHNQSSEYM